MFCSKIVHLLSWISRTNHYIRQIVVISIRRRLFAAEKHRRRNLRDRRPHESVKRVSENSKQFQIIQRSLTSIALIVYTECIEYQEPVYERVSISVGVNSKPIENKIFRCSIAYVPLIVGGEGLSICFTHFTNSFDKSPSISQMQIQKNSRIW